MKRYFKYFRNIYLLTILQFLYVVLVMEVLRVVFALYNADVVGRWDFSTLMQLCVAGLPYDFKAASYFNLPFLLMRFLPFSFVTGRRYMRISNIAYGVGNTLMLILAIGDIPYFAFSGARLRWQGLLDLLGDTSMLGVLASYSLDYWWAFLLGLGVIASIWIVGFKPKADRATMPVNKVKKRRVLRTSASLLCLGLSFLCLRGGVSKHPLTLITAFDYITDLRQYNIVLNTPFSVITTIGASHTVAVYDFYTPEQLSHIRSSLHHPIPAVDSLLSAQHGKNIVIINLESGGSVWLDTLAVNKEYAARNLQPFLNDLAGRSLAVRHTMGAGVRTIEGLTSIFGGFPTYGTLLYLSSPYSTDVLDAHPALLREMGYDTKYYYGGSHGAFSIDQLLGVAGFSEVTCKQKLSDELSAHGTWGVYDHELAEYAARDMSSLRQPFYAGMLTLQPHAPYETPDGIESVNDESEMLAAVQYSDYAVRRFFEEAAKQPWFDNTVFIITADHGFRDLRNTDFMTHYLRDHITFLIYAPDGSIKPRIVEDRVLSQFDIGPTVLDIAGYPKDYVALGRSLFDPEAGGGFAVSFNSDTYIIYGPNYTLLLPPDMRSIAGVYDHKSDPTLSHPLSAPYPAEVDSLLTLGRAFIQDYSDRLRNNHMSIRTERP